jgi:hypothetical protein
VVTVHAVAGAASLEALKGKGSISFKYRQFECCSFSFVGVAVLVVAEMSSG